MLYRADDEAAASAVEALAQVADAGHFAVRADLADIDRAAAATRESAERLGGAVDIAVLNAGIGMRGAPFYELSAQQWRGPFDVNVDGHAAVLRALYPSLRAGASVIFISSGAGHDPIENLSAYGAAKAALNHLSSVLAQEWGPRGIRVNTISPGSTAKEAVDYENLTEGQKQTIAATALRRIGTADDVADVALFYASDLSSFVTGQWLRVNGGRM
jgi:3-oxoacyl-[acyl-carrier protein] reductase